MPTIQINTPELQGKITFTGNYKPDIVEADFDGPGDSWDCGSIPGAGANPDGSRLIYSGGVARSVGPWMDDDNHAAGGIGRVQHALLRNTAAWGPVNTVSVINARMFVRFRGVGWSPGACRARPWVQSRFADSSIVRHSNYVYMGEDGDFTDLIANGQWHEREVLFRYDPSLWLYMPYVNPDPNNYYGEQPLHDHLDNLSNFFPFMFCRATGSTPPSGELQIDKFRLLFSRKFTVEAPPPPPPSEYATWSPTDKAAGFTLFDNNLRAVFSGAAQNAIRVNKPLPNNCYWEVRAESLSGTAFVGIAQASASITKYIGEDNFGIGWLGSNGALYRNNYLGTGQIGQLTAWGNGKTMAFHYLDGTLRARLDGVWMNSGNPVVTGLTGTWYAAGSDGSSGSQDSGTLILNAGGSSFRDPAPEGATGII